MGPVPGSIGCSRRKQSSGVSVPGQSWSTIFRNPKAAPKLTPPVKIPIRDLAATVNSHEMIVTANVGA